MLEFCCSHKTWTLQVAVRINYYFVRYKSNKDSLTVPLGISIGNQRGSESVPQFVTEKFMVRSLIMLNIWSNMTWKNYGKKSPLVNFN